MKWVQDYVQLLALLLAMLNVEVVEVICKWVRWAKGLTVCVKKGFSMCEMFYRTSDLDIFLGMTLSTGKWL